MKNGVGTVSFAVFFLSLSANAATPEQVAALGKKIVGTWTYEATGKDCKKGQEKFSSFGSEAPCAFKGEIVFKADMTFTCKDGFKGDVPCSQIEPRTWATAADATDHGQRFISLIMRIYQRSTIRKVHGEVSLSRSTTTLAASRGARMPAGPSGP